MPYKMSLGLKNPFNFLVTFQTHIITYSKNNVIFRYRRNHSQSEPDDRRSTHLQRSYLLAHAQQN